MSSFNMVKIWDGIPTITLTGYAVDSTVYKMLDHAGRAVPYGRARENRASHMGKQRLSHGVTTIGFCYGTSGTLGTEGTDAQERVPPAWRYEATTDATRREGHAPAWPGEGGTTDARGIPRPKAVREADALAGVRVPPADATG